MSLAYTFMQSPIGDLKLVASDKGVVAILWENDNPCRVRLDEMTRQDEHPILVETERQLTEYLAGARETFSVPLDLRGTRFQKDVWEALLAIPFGTTTTYRRIAEHLGNSNATRAVGAANGRNPLSIMVPCHRVIGTSGKLTGFAGGLAVKAHLLSLEANQTRLGALRTLDFEQTIQSHDDDAAGGEKHGLRLLHEVQNGQPGSPESQSQNDNLRFS